MQGGVSASIGTPAYIKVVRFMCLLALRLPQRRPQDFKCGQKDMDIRSTIAGVERNGASIGDGMITVVEPSGTKYNPIVLGDAESTAAISDDAVPVYDREELEIISWSSSIATALSSSVRQIV